MIIGVGAVVGVAISWLLPKLSKPAAVAAPVGNPIAPVAKGPVAAAQGTSGPVRDYNLSGLAIEELENYPVAGGVSLAGI